MRSKCDHEGKSEVIAPQWLRLLGRSQVWKVGLEGGGWFWTSILPLLPSEKAEIGRSMFQTLWSHWDRRPGISCRAARTMAAPRARAQAKNSSSSGSALMGSGNGAASIHSASRATSPRMGVSPRPPYRSAGSPRRVDTPERPARGRRRRPDLAATPPEPGPRLPWRRRAPGRKWAREILCFT